MRVYIDAPIICSYCRMTLVESKTVKEFGKRVFEHPIPEHRSHCHNDGKLVAGPYFELEEYPLKAIECQK